MQKIRLPAWAKLCVNKLGLISLFLPLHAFSQITSCNVATSGINFGVYKGSPLSMTGQLSISCNDDGVPQYLYLGLDPGNLQNRTMAGSGGQLQYNIYQDSAHGKVWSTNPAEIAGPFLCIGSENRAVCQVQPLIMYGFMPGGQPVSNEGSYSQNISVIVSTSPTLANYLNVTNTAVQASFQKECSMSAGHTNLGNYDTHVGLQTMASINLDCNTAGLYAVTLKSQNALENQSGGGIMKNGAHALNYNIFKPSGNLPNSACAYSVPWGENLAYSNELQINQPNMTQFYNVCISIPPHQDPPAGVYTDTITATIFF